MPRDNRHWHLRWLFGRTFHFGARISAEVVEARQRQWPLGADEDRGEVSCWRGLWSERRPTKPDNHFQARRWAILKLSEGSSYLSSKFKEKSRTDSVFLILATKTPLNLEVSIFTSLVRFNRKPSYFLRVVDVSQSTCSERFILRTRLKERRCFLKRQGNGTTDALAICCLKMSQLGLLMCFLIIWKLDQIKIGSL